MTKVDLLKKIIREEIKNLNEVNIERPDLAEDALDEFFEHAGCDWTRNIRNHPLRGETNGDEKHQEYGEITFKTSNDNGVLFVFFTSEKERTAAYLDWKRLFKHPYQITQNRMDETCLMVEKN